MIIVRPERWLGAAAVVVGAGAWLVYLQQGLVLSHYDAKAHLVVARRVIDSITPGWQQVGAVWLPLPHLIQIVPTQIDLFYRTGAFGSWLSILSFAVATWAAARLVLGLTGSSLGALTAAGLLLLNPNLLYLQSTPMTEPLLLAVVFVAVLWTWEWMAAAPAPGSEPCDPGPAPGRLAGVWFAAAWTRYEAWPVIAVSLTAVAYTLWRRQTPPRLILRRLAGAAAAPGAALVLFLLNSRITVGAWFVTGGFYVPDPAYEGQALRSVIAVWWGTHRLSGYVLEIVALAAAAAITVRAVARRDDAAALVPLALLAAAVLPFYAFFAGHPFRIRYMVPMVATAALFGGVAVGLLRTPALRAGVAALLVASSLVESPPGGAGAPLLQEAQWDLPRSRERGTVSACLAPEYGGEKIMASMGSLAHYMQELSAHGFVIADFLHEGNGVIWNYALTTGPAPHVGWMLVEEEAEGGDVLAQRIRSAPGFARGMRRVCEGGGVALYRRGG